MIDSIISTETEILVRKIKDKAFIWDYKRQHRPTQTAIQKWLRERFSVHIVIIPTVTAAWTFKTLHVLSEVDNDVIDGLKSVSDLPPYKDVSGEDFSTYEQALEGGLLEALKLI